MKFVISMLLTALLGFTAALYLPWWIIAVCAFIVSILILQQPLKAFLSGFCGIFLLWFVLAWSINSANDRILARKIAELFPLGGIPFLLMFVGGLVAGLVAGLAALSGSYLRYGAKVK